MISVPVRAALQSSLSRVKLYAGLESRFPWFPALELRIRSQFLPLKAAVIAGPSCRSKLLVALSAFQQRFSDIEQ
jgi:hypothetical protein